MDIFDVSGFAHNLLLYIKKSFSSKKSVSVIVLVILIAAFLILYKTYDVNALSSGFIQTDWSGGADVSATANSTNLTNWTKFYSKTAGVDTDTAGEVKLKVILSTPSP